jgi:LacI family transcriptional regulator
LATMADVARRAGVSVSTVSHVLNKTRTVTPETARAVEAAIAEVGFTPNILARSLVRSSTNAIGVALSAITNIYFGEVVRGIQSECARHGLMMFFADTEDNADHQFEVVRELHQRRVDGMILAPVPDPEERTLTYLKRHNIPVVFVDRSTEGNFDQVVIENKRSMMDLVAHLVGHGHRRIALIAGLDGLSTTIERVEGYRAGLAEAALSFDKALVENGESDIEAAYKAVQRLLGKERPPTAIVAANNKMTIGAMKALRESGRHVPKDIALVGFDDFEWADSFEPRLTVIAQPCHQMGVRAISELVKRMKNGDKRARTIRLPAELKIRSSCGCL